MRNGNGNGNGKWEMTNGNEKWEMEMFNFAHCGYELTEKDFFVSLYKNELLLV